MGQNRSSYIRKLHFINAHTHTHHITCLADVYIHMTLSQAPSDSNLGLFLIYFSTAAAGQVSTLISGMETPTLFVSQHYLNRESVVGVEHFGLRFRKHFLQPLLHHLREPTGPRIIAGSHELQHWNIKIKST